MAYIKAFTVSRASRISPYNDDCFLSGSYVPDSFSMEIPDQPQNEFPTASVSRQTAGFAVFSGLGDRPAARVAAQTAAEIFKDEVPRLQMLPLAEIRQLINRCTGLIEDRFLEIARLDVNLADLGSHFAMMALRGNQAVVVNAGSCKVIAYRAGQIRQISADSPEGSHLGRTGQPERPEVAVSELFDLRDNDRYLLMSPGLATTLDDETIRSCLEYDDPQSAARRLVAAAAERSGQRSLTCTVLFWMSREPARESSFEADTFKPGPVKAKIEHVERPLKRDLGIQVEKPKLEVEPGDKWDHFPVWAGYVGLGLILALAVLVYLAIKYFSR